MNSEVYVFGELGNGYTQYPDNYTKDLFKSIGKGGKSCSKLSFIHEGNLAYYVYTRPLRNLDSYIGLCCVFNNVLYSNYKSLFDTFEEAVTNMAINGTILEFTDSGEIVSRVDKLYMVSSEFQRVSGYLSTLLSKCDNDFLKLPVRNYSLSSNETKTFSYDDKSDDVLLAMKNYCRVFVVKSKDIDSKTMTSFAGKLKTLNQKIVRLESEKSKLNDDLQRVMRQKKRTKTVAFLAVLLFVIGLILYFAVVESNERQTTINELNDEKSDLIENLEYTNQYLTLTIDSLSTEREHVIAQEREIVVLNATNSLLRDSLSQSKSELKFVQSQLSDLQIAFNSLEQRTNNSSLTEKSYINGASRTSNNSNNFDKSYVMWLYASRSVTIKSFYVKANNSGYIRLGLFNSSGSLVSSVNVYVNKNSFTKVTPNFYLNSSNYYYLGIYQNDNDISLSYHSSGSNEYNNYSSSGKSLKIIGYSSKGKGYNDCSTGYYQYFYDIEYVVQ